MVDPLIPDTASIEADVYTVSRLNRAVRGVLSDCFATVWVEGELSNLATPSSGHIYFTLKDAGAQVRCAMFRTQRRRLRFTPKEGDQVLVKAQVSLYKPRGDYQLIVERMQETGDGALRRAFEVLQQRLFQEGLFDARHKKPIPALPQAIGVITSPTGAAIHDILTVLKRRFPAIPVLLYPTAVQGEQAITGIVRAIKTADRRKDSDVLILARGGGSLEDLWAFNEEAVARALFACTTPIVTGIGHEIDISIADFVADLRAPTPSAAAETVSPDQNEWLAQLEGVLARLKHSMTSALARRSQSMSWLEKRLQLVHPGQRLQHQARRLDELEQRFKRSMAARLEQYQSHLHRQSAQLRSSNPAHRIQALHSRQQLLSQRMTNSIACGLEKHRHRLAELSHALNTVSPPATLARGYAIVKRCDDQRIVRSHQQVQAGDAVYARLADGSLICRVEESHEGSA